MERTVLLKSKNFARYEVKNKFVGLSK